MFEVTRAESTASPKHLMQTLKIFHPDKPFTTRLSACETLKLNFPLGHY